MANFFTSFSKDFALFAAHEKPAVCLPRLKSRAADWAVIKHPHDRLGTLYYVLEKSRFTDLLRDHEEDFDKSLATILDLHEPDANVVISLEGRVIAPLGLETSGWRAGRFSNVAVLVDQDHPVGVLSLGADVAKSPPNLLPSRMDLSKTKLPLYLWKTRQAGPTGLESIT